MSVAQGSTRFADMPFKQTKWIFRSRHDKLSFSNGRKLINGLDMLQSVEFGITKNKSSDWNCGGWERESCIAVFLTSCFHWEKNAGGVFFRRQLETTQWKWSKHRKVTKKFYLFHFLFQLLLPNHRSARLTTSTTTWERSGIHFYCQKDTIVANVVSVNW